jgi:magnesium transporter
MLRLFGPDCPIVPIDPEGKDALPQGAVWIDLLDPTKAEEALAEKFVGINIPTREELSEIEPSSRLYQSRDATVMTMSVLHGITDGKPASDPVGFILTDNHLVTVRYIDSKPFVIFAEHVYADPALAKDARTLLVRLLDAVVDRLADVFVASGRYIVAI